MTDHTMQITRDLVTILVFDITGNKIIDSSQALIENGIIDSLGLIRLIVALEERFEILFELEELNLESFSSIEKVSWLVEQKRGARQGNQ
ncbi:MULTISPECIES: phosphopantetheine-binding protein [unclassified Paenibacillus]|uniref:phosphopantetheine-binding protein n=1 Tax=unclassified Paenibacillus TaxID=185978 RepID=UPI0015A11F6C